MNDITIVMTTWFNIPERLEVAKLTLESWQKNLKYSGDIYLHVADDGSHSDYFFEPEEIWDGPITFSWQKRKGVGASLNAGFKQAFKRSPLVLYMVDDWELLEPFDLDPWVQVLEEREDVGIVRLGPPHPHLYGKFEPITTNWQGWVVRLDRHGLVVGHRPEIFHKRMIDAYGWFDENVNACECERLYTERYAHNEGPDIVYALPHPWFHRDKSVLPNTSEIDPGEEIDV